MSSGSQIGGIIGGTIGFVASGFNPMGFKAGYLIGSAIGGYIDPVQVKGPRITDAQAMTSTVGGVITDGYGTFTTLTNVIYCSKTEEKANRSRGKGGGTKTTTYSYYRSYAIGVCVGPVDGIKWIKRNGKKVYTTDPNATAEEKQYSAKFAKKLRIYLGTEDQPVDPVMVADKGVGNVSAHLGLCYFTVEKDDLTDTGVIVPTYEVCVIKSGMSYITTTPYPLETGDAVSVGAAHGSYSTRDIVRHATSEDDSVVAGRIGVFTMRQPRKDVYSQNDEAVVAGTIGRFNSWSPRKDVYSQNDNAQINKRIGRFTKKFARFDVTSQNDSANINSRIGRFNKT